MFSTLNRRRLRVKIVAAVLVVFSVVPIAFMRWKAGQKYEIIDDSSRKLENTVSFLCNLQPLDRTGAVKTLAM